MAKKELDGKIKEQYMEYKIVSQGLKQMQGQVEKVQEQLAEIMLVIENLEDLRKLKKGTDMMVPVANGIFLKTSLNDNSELLVNVGGSTVVKKSFADVSQMLSKQQAELEEVYSSILAEFQNLHMRSEELEEKLKKLVSESEEE